MMRPFAGIALLAGVMAALPVSIHAQADRAAETSAIRAEIARLTARLDKLEGKRGPVEPAPAPAAAVASSGAPSIAYQLPPSLTENAAFRLSAADVVALRERTVAGATLDRALLPSGNAFELSATNDATSVAIKITRSASDWDKGTGKATNYALIASAPLVTSGRFSDLGTLDGFVGGSRLRLQFNRYLRTMSEPDLNPAYKDIVDAVKAACRARLGAAVKDCAPDLVSSQFVHDNAPELETPLLAMAHMTPGPNPRIDWSARAYGVEMSVGYKKFDFLEAAPARNRARPACRSAARYMSATCPTCAAMR